MGTHRTARHPRARRSRSPESIATAVTLPVHSDIPFDEQMSDQMSMELLQEWVQQETSRKLAGFDLNDNGTAQP